MILIADSGSTKTDWRLIDGDNVTDAYTEGLNPYFKNPEDVVYTLKDHLIPQLPAQAQDGITAIHFYGAGCSSPEKNHIIFSALQTVWGEPEIHVEHDLLGAARSLCGNEPGIAAILGTGSNSCYFDGNNVIDNVRALGFILGDEGSGAHIGKTFVQDYLNKNLDPSMVERFDNAFNLSPDDILHKVYKDPLPNRFLATFSKWLGGLVEEETYAEGLIDRCLDEFLRMHICKYAKHKELPLNVVGSVGFNHQDRLRVLANDRKITLGKVIKSPILGLLDFHKP